MAEDKVRGFLQLCVLLVVLFCKGVLLGQVPTAGEVAQNSPPSLTQLTLEQLGNIEVTTASKTPEQLWKTAAAIYVISQDDIRRSGATSIPEALRLAPGVEVGEIAANNWAIGIRGLQSNFSKSVLVLIDGRSVYTPLFAGVYWDVQDLPLEDIDRIEVIRGPGGTIWGPNAVNGVINIITRSSADTHGAMVSLSGGNVDKTVDSARYGGGNGNGFNYRIFGRGFIRGPEFHSDVNFDQYHQERAGFRTDWDKGKRDTFTFQGDAYRGDSPHRLSIGSLIPPTLGIQITADDTVSGGDLLARWRRHLSNGSEFYLQGYVDRTQRIGPGLGESRNTVDVDFLHRLTVGKRNEFTYGGGLRWSPYYIEQTSQSIDVLPHRDTDHVHSLFFQDQLAVIPDRLVLTGGVKIEHTNFSGFDAQPTVRVLWNPSEHQSLWAAVTRAVTTPSRLEEGFDLNGVASVSPEIVLRVSGNPKFQSESLIGFEGGYRQLFGKSTYVDLDVFHNRYRDLQSFGAPTTAVENTPPAPHLILDIPYANDIAGTTDGFELAPTWNATSNWRLSGSYSFLTSGFHASVTAANISSTGSIQTYEGSSPRHEVEARSYLTLHSHIEFDQLYRYESALPAQNVKAYQTMDTRLGFNWRQLQFSIVGQNLFQPKHFEWGTGDPSQPLIGIRRAVYARIVWMSEQ